MRRYFFCFFAISNNENRMDMNRTLKAIAALMVIGILFLFLGCNGKTQSGIINGHAYVDLGLPSGTLWATCNVGASEPEDYGNYYAWGETTTKITYNLVTYKYANGSYIQLTKYCNDPRCGNDGFIDNLTTLQASDDPATANWGGGWRTPTNAQWNELMNYTTNNWIAQNGVKGRLFTSKKNGNSLFLPAAGFRWDNELRNAGDYGCYWSSSLDTGVLGNVEYFDFYSDGYHMHSDFDRVRGQSVRAVR